MREEGGVMARWSDQEQMGDIYLELQLFLLRVPLIKSLPLYLK